MKSFAYILNLECNPFSEFEDESLEVLIPLPVSDGYQKVSGLEFAPGGKEINDSRGNRMVLARLERGQTITVKAEITNLGFTWGQSRLELPPPGPEDLAEDVLIPLSPEIRALATELTSGLSSDEAKARAIYGYVRDRVAYQYPPAERGAQSTLWRKEGDCGEYAFLFCAFCRAVGIPARPVLGAFVGVPGFLWHAWAECWLEAGGWVPVDANLGREAFYFAPVLGVPANKDFYFGNLDRQRLVFSRGSGIAWPGELPQPVPLAQRSEYPAMIVDGQPFLWGLEVFKGKIPYLQFPYYLGSKPAPEAKEKLKLQARRHGGIANPLALLHQLLSHPVTNVTVVALVLLGVIAKNPSAAALAPLAGISRIVFLLFAVLFTISAIHKALLPRAGRFVVLVFAAFVIFLAAF